jgi:glycosyltransferase involved in cell wall biosynthesis|tara:strand:+ start:400 stop:1524 length:1125 start_codon:yes stop_codon:yes gene_type:complete
MKKKLIFFVAEDWYFVSHRIQLAIEAKKKGYDVHLVTNCSNKKAFIESFGIKVHNANLSRKSFNIINEIKTIVSLYKIYSKISPDIVHHVAIKPILYGMIVCRYLGITKTINAFAGLTFIFWSDNWKIVLVRPFFNFIFRYLLNFKDSVCLLQNKDDADLLIKSKVIEQKRVHLIRGSGVDLKIYESLNEKKGKINVILASRLQRDKGIVEFVKAASILLSSGVNANFILVGMIDDHNPSSIEIEKIKKWEDKGLIRWVGYKKNMIDVFSNAHIVCLPSYREGLPKVLLEAAASARPIVAADVPGCREIVIHDCNGYLVPAKNIYMLANYLKELINNKNLRLKMGANGRRLVEENFDIKIISEKTISLYDRLIK